MCFYRIEGLFFIQWRKNLFGNDCKILWKDIAFMLDWASKACILREFLKETKFFNFTMSIHSVIF